MQREYGGIIFTKHALERLDGRSITQDMVLHVLRDPEITKPTGKRDTTKFIKTLHDRRVHVVATYLHDQKKWLVVSVWVRGEEDQLPLVWRIITAPFKLVWYVVRKYILHIRWVNRKNYGKYLGL